MPECFNVRNSINVFDKTKKKIFMPSDGENVSDPIQHLFIIKLQEKLGK